MELARTTFRLDLSSSTSFRINSSSSESEIDHSCAVVLPIIITTRPKLSAIISGFIMHTKTLMQLTKLEPPRWLYRLYFFGIPIYVFLLVLWHDSLLDSVVLAVLTWLGLLLLYNGMQGKLLLTIPFIKSIEARILSSAKTEFEGFIGSKPRYFDVIADSRLGQSSGSGLAYADGHLYLMEQGRAAKVPWEKVRGWSWKVEGHDQLVNDAVMPDDVGRGTAIMNANVQAAAVAHSQSGLFVDVASIEHPQWQIGFKDQKLLNKWYEIFNQLRENSGMLSP